MSGKKTSTDKKRRGNYGPWLRLLKRLAVVAVVLLIGFLVWSNWEKIAPEALLDWTEQQFGEAETGEGFPRPITGNVVVDMAEVNQHLAVLSDTTLRFFNGTAACVTERAHSFAEPSMHTAGNYVLLTEVGGDRIRLETRRETVLEKQLTNRCIYATDLLSNGTTALILNSTSQSYLSEVQVLNAKGNVKFTYQSNKYLLTDVALSPNGKQLAVVGTTAGNGTLRSVVLTITLSNGNVKEYTGTDTLLHSVTFFSNGTVMAIGDNAIWSVTRGADEPDIYSCDGYEPVGYTATSSLAIVALRRVGTTDTGAVWMFDTHGNQVQNATYEGTFCTVSARGTDVLLLTDRYMYEMETEGVRNTYEVPLDSLRAVSYRGSPLLLTLSEFTRIEKNS